MRDKRCVALRDDSVSGGEKGEKRVNDRKKRRVADNNAIFVRDEPRKETIDRFTDEYGFDFLIDSGVRRLSQRCLHAIEDGDGAAAERAFSDLTRRIIERTYFKRCCLIFARGCIEGASDAEKARFCCELFEGILATAGFADYEENALLLAMTQACFASGDKARAAHFAQTVSAKWGL